MPERHAGRQRVVAALLAVPLGVLVLRAFADAWRAPSLWPQQLGLRGVRLALRGDSATALVNSLEVAGAAVAIALLVGWPAARVLGERRLRRPGLVLVLLAMPLLTPGYVVGTGLSQWLIRLRADGTLGGLVLVHLTFVVPYVVIVLVAAFGPRLRASEELAATVGLTPSQRLRWVTLPTVAPTLSTAALLGFLVSWGQYGASLAVGAGRPMLPIVLLPFVGSDPQVAAALALAFLAPAIAALVLSVRAARG